MTVKITIVSYLPLSVQFSSVQAIKICFICWLSGKFELGQKKQCLKPGGGGALPYKPIRDAPFFGVSFFSV